MFVIGSVCVALFAGEGEIGNETMLEGFNRGQVVALNAGSDKSISARGRDVNATWTR